MAVQYRAFSTGNGSASLTIAPPTGHSAGDMLLMFIVCGTHTPTLPDGWNLLTNTVQHGSSPGIQVYWKIDSGSEPANYTVTWSSGSGGAYIAAFYSDVPEDLAIDQAASQDNASSGNRVWPSVVTAHANEMLFMGGALAINTGSTAPGGSDERIDQLLGTAARFYLMTEVVASAGATGTRTATGSTSASKTAMVSIYEDTAAPPPGAPDAPTDLAANAISPSRIELGWADNSDDEDGFSIERSLTGIGEWSEVATVGADVESYTDTGLDPETIYYYRVRAYRVDP